jgi:hypothetical protein
MSLGQRGHDELRVEDGRQQVLEEHHGIELADVDLNLAVGAARAAEGGERRLELAFDAGVGLGVGAGEHQTAHALGVPQRQLLRDHAAHRHADDVGALDPQLVE